MEFASGIAVWQVALLTAFSFAVGILGGFVGLALGTIRLPMMLLLGMAAPIAGGTNILVSGLASLAGAARHWREGRVNLRIVLVMGVPACIGALVGGFMSDAAPTGLLILLAGLLVFWQGVEFLIMVRERSKSGTTKRCSAANSPVRRECSRLAACPPKRASGWAWDCLAAQWG